MPDPTPVTTIRRGLVSGSLNFVKAHPKTFIIGAFIAIVVAVVLTRL